MKPEVNTLWQFIGTGGTGQGLEKGIGQLHQVVFSGPLEVITVGMPYGNGFSWLGTPFAFRQQFQFKAVMP